MLWVDVRRAGLTVALVAGALGSGCAEGGDEGGDVDPVGTAAEAVSQAPVPPPPPPAPTTTPAPAGAIPFAVVGNDSVSFDQGVVVTGGHVGVRSTSPFGDRLVIGPGVKLDTDKNAVGLSVRLEAGSMVGPVLTNHLTNNGGTHGPVLPFVAPEATPISAATTGTTPIVVAPNQSLTLEPGAYGPVTLGAHATVTLTGGVYDLASLTLGPTSSVKVASPTLVRSSGDVVAGANTFIGPAATAVAVNLKVVGLGNAIFGPVTVLSAESHFKGSVSIGANSQINGVIEAGSLKAGAKTRFNSPPEFHNTQCGIWECPFVRTEPGLVTIGKCILFPLVAGTSCDDGSKCTDADQCDGAGACGGTSKCAPGDGCHEAGICDPLVGCAPPVLKADGTGCGTDPVCDVGTCKSGQCVHAYTTEPCGSPGTECRAPSSCKGGTCQEGPRLLADHLCDAHQECKVGTCDAAGTCSVSGNAPDGTVCGPNETCFAYACFAGACVQGAFVCDTKCKTSPGQCDETGCHPVNAPDGSPCGPAGPGACTASCLAGVCQQGHAAPKDANCGQKDMCSAPSKCDDGGTCIAGTALPIDDGNPNTLDTCDPVTGAIGHALISPIAATVPTDVKKDATFLFTGSQPIQTGPDGLPLGAGAIDGARLSILHGQVVDQDMVGVVGVRVSFLAATPSGEAGAGTSDSAQAGSTVTRAASGASPAGVFDIAVSGGGSPTLLFEREGYHTVHRAVDAPWRDHHLAPQVVMTPIDRAATVVTLDGSSTEAQPATGSFSSDTDGIRQPTLIFPPNTQAMMADGMTALNDPITIRMTEFTVGRAGPAAMPASLPPSSGYTYSVELTADEHPQGITFAQPVFHYLENFPGFKTGSVVPVGFYDRETGAWNASEDGLVIGVVDTATGKDIDTGKDASGNTIQPTRPIGPDEKTEILKRYPVGQTLWRVPISHFSAWDCNWPYGPPPNACRPDDPSCGPGDPAPPNPKPDDPCSQPGSTIECESQVLGERIPIVGTPFSLNYRSDRFRGRKEAYSLQVPLCKTATCDPLIKRIQVSLEVAGNKKTYPPYTCPCVGLDKPVTVTWDGTDAWGRQVQGAQPATVTIDYVYDPVYWSSRDDLRAAFAMYSSTPGADISILRGRTTNEIVLSKIWRGSLGALDHTALGIGGWDLDVVHAYDPGSLRLDLGTGERRTAQGIHAGLATIVGGDPKPYPNYIKTFSPTGGALCGGTTPCTAMNVYINSPTSVAADADGSVYFADIERTVRKISVDGSVTYVASHEGCPALQLSGIPGPATSACFSSIDDLAVGPDGSLYIADVRAASIFRVANGNVTTAAGVGSPCSDPKATNNFCDDGAPATQAHLDSPRAVAVAPDGTLYIAEGESWIRRVGPDGIIQRVAGSLDTSSPDFFKDGPALDASLVAQTVAVGPDGSVYAYGSTSGSGVIRRLLPNGMLVTIGGRYTTAPDKDGVQATTAFLPLAINHFDLAVASDGSVFFTDYYRVRRIGTDGILTTVAGSSLVFCNGNSGDYCGDGAATAVGGLLPRGVAITPNGSVVLAGNTSSAAVGAAAGRILRVTPGFPQLGASEIQIPSEDGREVYVFDSTGKHLRTADRFQAYIPGSPAKYTFGYEPDAPYRLTSITDAAGNKTTIDWAAHKVKAPTGGQSSFTLSNGKLASFSNPKNESYNLTYYTTNGLLWTFKDPVGNGHTFEYDPNTGRLTKDSDPASGVQSLALGTDRQTVTRTANVDATTTYDTTYSVAKDASGVENRSTTFAGLTAKAATTIQTSGSFKVTLADGSTIETTLHPDPIFQLVAPTTDRTVTSGSATMVMKTSRGVDAACAAGASVNTQLCETTLVDPDTSGASTKKFSWKFDATTNQLVRTTPCCTTTTTFYTDGTNGGAPGQVKSFVVPGLGTTDFTYTVTAQNAGQVKTITRSAAGEADRLTTYNYATTADATNGTLSSIVDPINTTTFDSYDLARRLTSATLAGGRSVGYGYDANGNMMSLTAPATQSSFTTTGVQSTHALGYSPINQLVQYDAPLVAIDPLDPTKIQDDRTFWDFTFDRRLAGARLPDGAGTQTGGRAAYAYTSGRLSTVTLPGTEGTITYDYGTPATTGQVFGITGPQGVDLAFGYDGKMLTSTTWKAGTPRASVGSVSHAYTDRFLMTSETLKPGTVLAFDYDDDGLLKKAGSLDITRQATTTLVGTTTLGSLVETFTYNGFGEVSSATTKKSTTVLWSMNYEPPGYKRDGLGRITARAGDSGGQTTYDYDPAGRLTHVTEFSKSRHYDYDANGNRLRLTSIGKTTIITDGTFDAQDRMLTYGADNATRKAFLNDHAGRRVAMDLGPIVNGVGSVGHVDYSYDTLGNLRSVEITDQTGAKKTVVYEVDGLGRRVSRRVNNALTARYVYGDGLRVVGEYDAQSGKWAQFVYGTKVNVPEYMIWDGANYKIVSDQVGTPLVVVADDGSFEESFNFDEFGVPPPLGTVLLASAHPLPFGFAGGLADPDTGLVHFGAREYDPEVGRWLSKDPILFAGGDTNLYVYAGNDPVNRIDPSGKDVWTDLESIPWWAWGSGAGLVGPALVSAALPIAVVGVAGLTIPGDVSVAPLPRAGDDATSTSRTTCDPYRSPPPADPCDAIRAACAIGCSQPGYTVGQYTVCYNQCVRGAGC